MLLRVVLFLLIFSKFLGPNVSQIIENRIIGGNFCNIEKIPYIAFMVTESIDEKTNQTYEFTCGGNIVSPSWILTAAHCFVHKNQTLVSVMVFANSSNVFSNTTIMNYLRKRIIHPGFDLVTVKHDIALGLLLLPLKEPMTYPVFVKTKLESDKCTEGFIAGWGQQSRAKNASFSLQLKCANITLCPKKKCSFSKRMLHSTIVLDGTKIYALVKSDGVSAYGGDSGGPLTCDGKLIGITSFTDADLQKDGCVVYTKIESYFKFIANHTGLKLPPWEPTDPEYAEEVSGINKTASGSNKHEEKLTSSYKNSFPNPAIIVLLLILHIFHKNIF